MIYGASEVPESAWYKPEEDLDALEDFCHGYEGKQVVHCVDAFGASRSMFKQWERAGMNARAFDVKLDPANMDLLTKTGFLTLLLFGLSLVEFGIIVAGLPCQWFIWLSSSVHKRSKKMPLGRLSHPKVRLANRIVDSFVVFIELLAKYRSFWVLCEQPKSSKMFALPSMLRMDGVRGMFHVATALGMFQHDLVKPTTLFTDLPGANSLARKVTKAQRQKIVQRLAKRNQKRKNPREYYSISTVCGKKCVSGSKDLAKSAAYPAAFSKAVLAVWMRAFAQQLMNR